MRGVERGVVRGVGKTCRGFYVLHTYMWGIKNGNIGESQFKEGGTVAS